MGRKASFLSEQLALGLGFWVAISLQPPRAVAAQQAGEGWDDWDVIPGKILVKYKPAESAAIKAQGPALTGAPWLSFVPIEQDVETAMMAQGLTTGFISILPDTFVGEFDPARRDEVIKALTADPNVVYFEPDRIRIAAPTWGTSNPNDPLRNQLWGMDRIGAPTAWGRQSATRSPIRVCVMDAGGRYDDQHRDLTAQHVDEDDQRDITDHATHVAGIIAATGNNNLDVVGVANISLVDLATSTTMHGMAEQISSAVNHGVSVMNWSWHYCGSGGCGTCSYPTGSDTEQDAIRNALDSIVFVASAGNESCRADSDGRFPLPVSYDGVIGVSAIDRNDTLASFSNHGPYVALTAPGVGILSTISDNRTANMSGTSMSAPHVSGSAGAVLAIQPTYNIRSIGRLLGLTAEHLGDPGRNENFGDGVVRVDRATAAIAEVYAETGGQCSDVGTLNAPYCTLRDAVINVPTGGRIGLVRGEFVGAITIGRPGRPLTLLSVGGTATIRP